MLRQTAYQILIKYLTNPTLLQHSLAVEATMRALAPQFGGDIEEWGIAGLLHDADYDKSKGHPEKHGLLLFTLEPNTIPTIVEHAIKAHNYTYTKILPESKMDWALVCCDELTGIIMQMMHEEKLAPLTSEFILQKLNDKNSFKDAGKENIFLCEEKLGIPLEEFITITLSAMQQNPSVSEEG